MSEPIQKSRIQQSLDRAWTQYRANLYKDRLQYVQKGFHSFHEGDLPGAVSNYLLYIRIMEEVKQVPEGKLSRSLFNPVSDQAEIVMLSSVYWDLLRIYDHAKSADSQRDFMVYAKKYVEFTKGAPHQHAALDTLRKYIRSKRSPHRDTFKQIFTDLGGKSMGCFVATALADDLEPGTMRSLRRFRDDVLCTTRVGREFVWWYYEWGPRIAAVTIRLPRLLRRIMAKSINIAARFIERSR